MSKYIIKRVLISIMTLAAIVFVLFLMLDFMPGSPFNDEKLTAAQKALLYTKYGLDKPFFVRFVKYVLAMRDVLAENGINGIKVERTE